MRCQSCSPINFLSCCTVTRLDQSRLFCTGGQNPCEAVRSPWSSAPERPRLNFLVLVRGELMTTLVSGAEVRTREGRVEDDTARTQAPSPTSSSARRRRRRPAGARSRDGPIVVKSRGYKIAWEINRPRGVDPHPARPTDRRRAPPRPVGTSASRTVATAAPSAPSPARTPASAAPRPSRAVPPRSARAAVPIVSAPAPSPAAASARPAAAVSLS